MKRASRIVLTTAAAWAMPVEAQHPSAGGLELQLGALTSTTALGTAEGYQVRLRGAPAAALVWNQSGARRFRARVIAEAAAYLWGDASPVTGCVGYCRPSGFTAVTTSLGADLVLPGPKPSTYLALGARGRAYVMSASCPAAPGAFCPGNDPLTDPVVRPALALAAGAMPRLGTRRLSIEVGYLPTWVRSGEVQHDLRFALGVRL